MASNYLFAEQFHGIHDMTVDQALAGYARLGGEVLNAKDYEDAVEEHMRRVANSPNKSIRLGNERDKPHETHSEAVSRILSEPRPIPDILYEWTRNNDTFLTGNPTRVARDIRDLTNEMNTAGRVNETKLYRGAEKPPTVEALHNKPLSFTEDPYVARWFALRNEGKTWKHEAGTVRGLKVVDYTGYHRTIGRNQRPEREWLIDPNSIAGRA